ncbi:MAG: calcium-binding EGF-like domain-containing protein [Saprospiraceae bacterium]|nr:calcium-binding EGF-like domain-containing protein [Saprospiraceae bacterium]
MKNFLLYVTLAFALTLLMTSCSKKDPCEDIICQNGGTCENGDCKCPAGYEGNFVPDRVVA